jgi:ferredoxin-NADP reductase
VKGSYYPILTEEKRRNHRSFEIVLPIPENRGYYRPKTILSSNPQLHQEKLLKSFQYHQDSLVKTLLTLSSGDEIAFKMETNSFLSSCKTREKSIDSISIILSGLGILPVLPLIESFLKSSSIDLELLWINPSKESYLYNEKVEDLEKEFPDSLSVVRILDAQIDNPRPEIRLNEKLVSAIAPYRMGSIAMVAGNSLLAKKFEKPLKEKKGFPRDNLIFIET